MNLNKALTPIICMLLAVPCLAQMPKPKGKPAPRAKVELQAGSGAITIEYSRPSLTVATAEGEQKRDLERDLISQLPVGEVWRMGANQATILSSPVDLTFGSVKIPKGSYSLFLKRVDTGRYELVFNSETGQWGLKHDPSKDVAQAPMKKETVPNPVETFTIELKSASGGGTLVLSWGTTQLSAGFRF